MKEINSHLITIDIKKIYLFREYDYNCRSFLKLGIRTHLLAYSILMNLNLYKENKAKEAGDEFVQRKKR